MKMWEKIRLLFWRLWGTFWIALIPLSVIWYAIKEIHSIWGWVFVIGFLAIFGGGILIGVQFLWKNDDWDDDFPYREDKGHKYVE